MEEGEKMNQFLSSLAETCEIQNLCVSMFFIVDCRIEKAFSSKKKAEAPEREGEWGRPWILYSISGCGLFLRPHWNSVLGVYETS